MSCNHLHKIGGICCQKIIPLVFEQSYSYYEQLCAFLHKLNELVEAVNLQNTTIAEFENEIDTLFNEFKNEMRLAFADFQIEMRQEFEDFTTQIETEWNAYKTELNAEWQTEKQLNAAFRSDIQTAWTNYQNQLNTQWNNYKTLVDEVLHTFDTNINQTIAEFTIEMREFKEDETAARTEFETEVNSSLTDMENRIDNINVGGQVESVPHLSALEISEINDPVSISNLPNFINSDFENNFVRVYHCADIRANPRVISFVKRVNFSDIATDTAIPNASGDFEMNILIFENPAICAIIAANGQAFGFLGRKTDVATGGNIQAGITSKIPVIGANITENNFDIELVPFQQFTYPSSGGGGTENLSGDFRNITTGGFLVLYVTNIHKDFKFRSTVTSVTLNTNISYNYDPANNKIVRDPATFHLVPQIMAATDDINTYIIDDTLSQSAGVARWLCPSLSVRNALLNLPADFPNYPDFEIKFEQFKNGSIGMQTIAGGSTSSMYVAKRFHKNGTFSPWFKVTLTQLT